MSACGLALLLAMDVSGSVSEQDVQMQRDATAAALTSPAVERATQDGLALAVTMWGSAQHVVLPWRVLTSARDAREAAEALRGVERPERGGTDVAAALRHAVALHEAAPCRAERRVVDLSGDGRHQGWAEDMQAAVEEAVAAEIETNCLPIVTEDEPDVATWYREAVCGLAGGFTIEATMESFGRAIRRKIESEVAGLVP